MGFAAAATKVRHTPFRFREVTAMTRTLRLLAALSFSTLALAGCGSGGSSDGEQTGALTLGITDAPLDSAASVVVTFTGVELKPKSGEPFSIDFASPKTIDLMTLQGVNRALILDGEVLPVGEYTWMRLKVEADPQVAGDSYLQLETDGAQCELRVPSGSESGLKLIRGFTIGAGTTTDITIDFDLRKSVVAPPGQQGGDPLVCGGQAFLLKPVLRLIDNLQVGAITGAIDPALIAAACPADLSAPYPGNVYLFGPLPQGETVAPDDYDGIVDDPNGEDALASALVDPDTFEYAIGFVPAGDYVVAYTCASDDVEVDADAPNDPPNADEVVGFTPADGSAVTVTADETSVVNFDAP
jgi:hypothetical protein